MTFNRTIIMNIDLVDPVAADRSLYGRKVNKLLSVSPLKGLKLLIHSNMPLWILDSLVIGLGFTMRVNGCKKRQTAEQRVS